MPGEPDGNWAGPSFLAGLGRRGGQVARMMDKLAEDMVASLQTPSVGRVVHYVSHGSPVREDGTQAYKSECRAAIITEIYYEHTYDESGAKIGQSVPDPAQRVGLAVLNPTGMFFSQGIPYDESNSGGSWHWPERAEEVPVTVTVTGPDPNELGQAIHEVVKGAARRQGGSLK